MASNPWAGAKTVEKMPAAQFKETFIRMQKEGLSLHKIALDMGYAPGSVSNMMARAERLGVYKRGAGFTTELPPDDVTPVGEILARKQAIFDRKEKHETAAKLVKVQNHADGPIGILHFGDPHIDDDGCDIATLQQHIKWCRDVDGLFGANVGDSTNNWVGRLAHLYGEQTTTATEAVRLLEWFVREVDWIYLIGGNHDAWSGARDPIDWIQRQRGALYTPSECRLELSFPGTKRRVTINARHDFNGHSMWNPAHGVGRSVQMGDHDDISVAGHRHVSGYMVLVAPDGRICHAFQIASYKRFDRYAKTKGFRNQTVEPAVVTLINPGAKTPAELVLPFFSVEAGVDYLKYLRRKK